MTCEHCGKNHSRKRGAKTCSPACAMAIRRATLPDRIRQLSRESWWRNREKRLADSRIYKADRKKEPSKSEEKIGVHPEYRYKYGGNAIKALQLDGACIRCQSKSDLIVHHFNKNKQDNRIENLVTLCRGCHVQLHNKARDIGNKNRMNPLIKVFGVYLATLRNETTGLIEKRQLAFNLVPTVGRSVLAQRLAGTTTYTGTVNYAALGSATTTPTNGDTQLGTEVYRQTITSATYVNNIAYLSCFIAQGSATGTHNEGGLFIDGTGSANTGQIFSHVLFTPAIVKSALNSLTLDVTLTLT